ncbi:MAG TPA: hemerythrin family protein [Burkholderiaceae bacterium]|jgi:hemerythrin-like metal-binding protein
MNKQVWLPQMTLGNGTMDASHRALMAAFSQVAASDDTTFAVDFAALTAAMETDFRDEEESMEKIDFPGIRTHREAHARVLSAMHHAMSEVQSGNFTSAREAISYLPDWFMLHITTLDAALALALELADTNEAANG